MKKECQHLGKWGVSTTPSANVSMSPLTNLQVPGQPQTSSHPNRHWRLQWYHSWCRRSNHYHQPLLPKQDDSQHSSHQSDDAKNSDKFLSFLHSHRQIRHNSKIWGWTDRWSIFIDRQLPSAELDTTSVNGAASLPYSQELGIADSTQELANDILHGGFIYSFIKISFNFQFQVWLHCLSAMTSASIFKDTSNDTQLFPKFNISIFDVCLHPINFKSNP